MPHKEPAQRRLLRNVFAEASARVFYLGTRFFIPPFVLARIGMEAYGLYGTLFILVAYFGISAIGFSNAYIKYVAEYAASGETDKANRLLSSGATIMGGTGIIGMAGFIFFWPAIAAWMRIPKRLDADARVLAFLVVGVFFAYLALSVFRDTLTGLQQIALVQRVWIGSIILETLLIFVLAGAGFGLRGMGAAFAARTIFEVGSHWWLAARRVSWLRIRPVKPDRESLRLLLNFGGVVQLNSVLSIFLYSVERFVATPLLGLAASGLLDLGKRFPSMATAIPSAFASSVLPSASDVHARAGSPEDGRAKIRSLYLSSARLMNTASGALFAFLAFAATPCMIFWLGKSAPADASVLTVLFSIGMQVHMLTGPGTSILKATGRPRMEFHYSVANLLALAILLPASRLLVGKWDVTGIAAAAATATIVSAIWFLLRANRALGASAREFLNEVCLPGVVSYAAAAVTLLPLLHWVAVTNRLEAACVLTVGGSLYFLVLVASLMRWVATTDEKESLRELIRRLPGAAALRRRSAPACRVTA